MKPSDTFIANAAVQIAAALSAPLMQTTSQDFPIEARNIAAGAWKIALMLHQEMPQPMLDDLAKDDALHAKARQVDVLKGTLLAVTIPL